MQLNFIYMYVANEIMELLDLLDYIYKRTYINKRLFVEYEQCLHLLSFLALCQLANTGQIVHITYG